MMKKFMLIKRVTLFIMTMAWGSQVMAHAWVTNAPVWSQSYAEAQVPGDHEIDNSGVVFGQSTATANAINATAVAHAHANSRGLWGGNVKTTAFGPGAWAGSENPFVNPIVAGVGNGIAEMDYDATNLGTGFLALNGTANWNFNGYLELTVLDISGLTESFVSDIFGIYGSVESAINEGYISNNLVLFSKRETDLLNNFSYNIDISSINDMNNILVSGLSHAVSAVPEPNSLLLLTLGLGVLTSRRLLRK
jgi:hypothetical protein